MADKAISELIAASQVTPTDLFVLEQSGTAKKLTGLTLENWLLSMADGHGGIHSIVKIGTSGLEDTYRITLADTTTFDFVVTNGIGINSITKTGTSGLVDTYEIKYNNGTSGTFTVTNGAKGDKGDNTYTHIKYASQEPTASNHSMGDVPDKWIGFYWGSSSTAPTDWTQYKWYQFKGDKGDTGSPATLRSATVEYQVGNSGTIIPSEAWTTSVPVVAQGKYLWTRTTQTFNTGSPVVSYSVARMGLDGAGSVVSVNNVSPNTEGNVVLTPEDVSARPNTWLPTPEEIGAALTGYGLGTGGVYPSSLGLTGCAIARGGFYRWDTKPDDAPFANGAMLVVPRSKDSAAFQIACCAAGTYKDAIAVRVYSASTASEWEYINPPMESGVEYRTAKRSNEKVVYTKRFPFGDLPNATSKRAQIPNFISSYSAVDIRFIMKHKTLGHTMQLTYGADPGYFVEQSSSSVINLVVNTTGDFSSYTGYVTIEYTK